jgi:alpha-ketoglutarate-dependent taurine dioxygenase
MKKHYYSPNEFPKRIKEAKNELEKTGIIFLKDIHSEITGGLLAPHFGKVVANLDASKNGITEITEEKTGNNQKNSRAFTRMSLVPHTDRSTIINPPKYLLNWVQEKSPYGGETLLLDGKNLYQEIKKEYPQHLKILLDKIAMFSDGINSYISPIFKKQKNGDITIRFRDDNCVSFSDEAKPAVTILQKLISEKSVSYSFEAGEGYLIDNTRWLHGRNAYSGHRLICRIHIN